MQRHGGCSMKELQATGELCIYSICKIRNKFKISNSEGWMTSKTNNSMLQVKATWLISSSSLPYQRLELKKALTAVCEVTVILSPSGLTVGFLKPK